VLAFPLLKPQVADFWTEKSIVNNFSIFTLVAFRETSLNQRPAPETQK
jgi:hypothetical protein